jgi:N-acyl-D-amino-acid deacylase
MRHSFTVLLAGLWLCASWACIPSAEAGTVIINARIVDGSGQPARNGAVRIERDRIVAVGPDVRPGNADEVIDATGLVLAPGFIDTHSHAVDASGSGDRTVAKFPDALAAVRQGVTTAVVGADGSSGLPLGPLLERIAGFRPAINVASYVGHGSIRRSVMGEDYRRAATPAEIAKMRELVAEAMRDGALGLSSGLEYDPGLYSTPAEVMALAEESAQHGGRYASHIRSEDRDLWEAIDEVIAIGRHTRRPVHISHMKLGMQALWGRHRDFIARLEAARAAGIEITGDVYPYDFWQTTLVAMFPNRQFDDLDVARASLADIAPAQGIRLTVYSPEPALVGRTLLEIAQERGQEPALTLSTLAKAAAVPDADDLATFAGMSQADVDALMQWPHTNVCSDGSLSDGHPRGAGAFSKIFRYYVREKGVLSMEEAVRKLTSLAARHAGLADRGSIRNGAYADLVLFDPAAIRDRATAREPRLPAVGVSKVWVNGSLVFDDGRATGVRTGSIIRRAR